MHAERDHQTRIAAERLLLASVKRNAVALISLAVALFGTSYNTWRNQTTESHRNVREASFKLIEQIGELQQITDRRFYGGDHSDSNRIEGWGRAALIRDMAMLVSPPVHVRAADVYSTWQRHVDRLDTGEDDSEQAISTSLAALRSEVLAQLQTLR